MPWVSWAVVGLAAAVVWFSIGLGPSDPSLTYDVERHRSVDPAVVLFAEVAAWPFSGVRAVAAGPEDRVWVGAGAALHCLTARGETVWTRPLAAEAGCVAVDDGGRAYVGLSDRVAVVDADGALATTWPSLGEQALLTGIAVGSGVVLVADWGNRRVWRFDLAGGLRGALGGRVGTEPRFVLPSPHFDVCVSDDGAFWVTDPGRRRVVGFARDGLEVGSWGASGMEVSAFCGCCNPTHLAAFPGGGFVTGEKGIPRVKVYGADGVFEAVVAPPSVFRPESTGLDVSADSRGRVLVADPAAGVVRVFERQAETGGDG